MDRHLRPTAIIGLIALLFAASIGLSSRGPATASAQEGTPSPVASPAATPASGASLTTLMERTLPLPAAPLTVRLLRITLEPEASVPLHTHPGPELDYVESGTLTVEVDGDAQIVRANGEEIDAPPDEAATLETGDWITFPPGTGMALRNTSDQPVELLSAVLQPVGPDVASGIEYVDGEPTADDFAGVTPTVLGDGLLETAPEGDATVSVQQVEIPAGSPVPAADSPVLLSHIDGNFSFAATSGSVQVSRTSDPGLRPEAVPDEEFTLATGDAAFFPAGHVEAARDGEPEALSVYRMVVDPAAETEGELAEITFLPPADIDAAATPGASPEADADGTTEDGTGAEQPSGDITEGTTVETIDDNVRLRAEPSTGGEILRALPAGTQMTVTGESEEADDFVWYPVEVADPDDPVPGWVAEDFIQVVEGDAAEATPEPEA